MRPSREFPQGDSNIVSVRKLLSLIFKSAKQMSLRLQSAMIEHFFSLLIIGRYLRSCSSCSSVWLVSVIDSHQQPALQLNASPWCSWSSSAVLPAPLVTVSLLRLPSSPYAAKLPVRSHADLAGRLLLQPQHGARTAATALSQGCPPAPAPPARRALG